METSMRQQFVTEEEYTARLLTSAGSQQRSSQSNTVNPVRKKTPGACERCREKRIKCNGAQPCDQCNKKDHVCKFSFTPSVGNNTLVEKLDLILSRLDRLEQKVNSQSVTWLPPPKSGDREKEPIPATPSRWVTHLNSQTGCFEHYGGTSSFVLASSLSKRIRQLEEDTDIQSTYKSIRVDRPTQPTIGRARDSESLSLNDLTGFCDYVVPSNALRHHRCLREDVADRHLENFFDTIHIFLPIFDADNFKRKYAGIRSLFGDHRLFVLNQESPNRQQFLCLLYSVLALGALYEDEKVDSSSWASWYFAEAQELLGRLLDAVNLELVQAAMLMGAYAQHVIKPNLAYNLTGIASRLAFSLALNIKLTYDGLPVSDIEEAKRTWWLIYIQEVELSLDSGRPISISASEMNMDYPNCLVNDDGTEEEVPQVTFVRYLAEIAKIMRRVLKLVNHAKEQQVVSFPAEVETLGNELQLWRKSIPSHIRFDDIDYSVTQEIGTEELYGWKARQQSSLRIHYYLAIIILHRCFLTDSMVDLDERTPNGKKSLTILYQNVCLDAARDMIRHIDQLFTLAPSLRRWSYYCFYCLQATLVILTKLMDDNDRSFHKSSQGTLETGIPMSPGEGQVAEDSLKPFCELAIHVFERIELKASKRCAEVVRRCLNRYEDRKRRRSYKRRRKSPPDAENTATNQGDPCNLREIVEGPDQVKNPNQQKAQLRPTEVATSVQPSFSSWNGELNSRPPFLMAPEWAKPGSSSGAPHRSSVSPGASGIDGYSSTLSPISLSGLHTQLYGVFCNDDKIFGHADPSLSDGDYSFSDDIFGRGFSSDNFLIDGNGCLNVSGKWQQ